MKLSNLLRKAQSVKQKLEHPYTAAVIVAAGSATRMGGVDKIFAPIAKAPGHLPDAGRVQQPSSHRRDHRRHAARCHRAHEPRVRGV